MPVAISILAFIVAISVLVAVHEFGHFWVAQDDSASRCCAFRSASAGRYGCAPRAPIAPSM